MVGLNTGKATWDGRFLRLAGRQSSPSGGLPQGSHPKFIAARQYHLPEVRAIKMHRRKTHKQWILICLFGILIGCGPEIESHSQNKLPSSAIEFPERTQLGQMATALAQSEQGKSGFLLLDRGSEALAWRLILADAAEKTIDAQYFLWKNDSAGKVLMQRLLAAADRGVRVRVMVDDSMTEPDPEYLAEFGAHPNVELRLYKPFGPKHKSVALRWLNYAQDLKVLNQRMHNKSFIVDGSFAIVGGRNIANEYFEYPGPFVFRCRDLMALGPVVSSTSTAFDLYWNSDWTIPIEEVVDPVPSAQEDRSQWEQLTRFAKDSANYPVGFFDNPPELKGRMKRLKSELFWGQGRLLVDAVPTLGGAHQSHRELHQTSVELGKLMAQTSQEMQIETAYLILLEEGLDLLKQANDRGVKITLATNSLASNNHVSAFVGYWKQRKKILETGAQLFEMRPDAASERALFTAEELAKYKTVFGLHCKTAVFDHKTVYVGSFNLDPRSVNLNSEMGFLVESSDLAKAVSASIQKDLLPVNSWQVVMQPDGSVAWVTFENGKLTFETDTDPMVSKKRRAAADLLLLVPMDSQL